MKLEQAFRMMMLKIGDKITLEECRSLAYVSRCMDDEVTLRYCANYRFHVLTTLESRGVITPMRLEFLENVLRNSLGRIDLLDIIEDYKKTSEYKKAIKKHSKKLSRSKRSRGSGTAAATLHPSAKDQYEKLYAQFLTQFSKLSVLMRDALGSNDLQRMRLASSTVATGAKELDRTMRKTITEIDNNDSDSSGESSGKIINTDI